MSKAIYYERVRAQCINVALSEDAIHTGFVYLSEGMTYKAPKVPSSWMSQAGYDHESLKGGAHNAKRISRCRAKKLLAKAGLGHLPMY